jgi:hypothetical protein
MSHSPQAWERWEMDTILWLENLKRRDKSEELDVDRRITLE